MSRKFKVGDKVELSGIQTHVPLEIYREGLKQGVVVPLGLYADERLTRVSWGISPRGFREWCYEEDDLRHTSIFYAETDKKGLIV